MKPLTMLLDGNDGLIMAWGLLWQTTLNTVTISKVIMCWHSRWSLIQIRVRHEARICNVQSTRKELNETISYPIGMEVKSACERRSSRTCEA